MALRRLAHPVVARSRVCLMVQQQQQQPRWFASQSASSSSSSSAENAVAPEQQQQDTPIAPHQQQGWTPYNKLQGQEYRFFNQSAGAYPEVTKHGIPATRKEASQRIFAALAEQPDALSRDEIEASHNMFGKPDPDGSQTVFRQTWVNRLTGVGRFVESVATRGPFEAVKRFLQMNESRTRGVFKGTDLYGNSYYEDLDAIFGRQRYVVYKKFSAQGGDASEVPAEWHGWLHSMTDECPTEAPPQPVAYKVRHRKMDSIFSEKDNYIPPGHYRRQDPKFSTQPYESWRPGQGQQQQQQQQE